MTFSAFAPIISTIGPIIIIATPAIGTDPITTTDIIFPVQREMESGRSPLMSIPPFGRDFQGIMGFSGRARLWRDPLARVVDWADPLASAFQMR